MKRGGGRSRGGSAVKETEGESPRSAAGSAADGPRLNGRGGRSGGSGGSADVRVTQDVRWAERGRGSGRRGHVGGAQHMAQQSPYRGQNASIYNRHGVAPAPPSTPPPAPVSSLSASATPFVIKASTPLLSSSHQLVHDLASLHAAYVRSPSSASALLLTAPPSAESLLSLLDELLGDMQLAVSRYHSPMHLRLLSVLLAWLTRTLLDARVAASATGVASADVSLLGERHTAHLCCLLQAMSAHRIVEIRHAVGQCVLAFVKTLSSSAAATTPTSSAAPLAASLCLLSAYQLDVIAALGQLAMERAVDDDSGVRAVYRQVVGWCGVRVAIQTLNPGREWKAAQDREQARARQAEAREQRRQREEQHRKQLLTRSGEDGEHKRADSPSRERDADSLDEASVASSSSGEASEEASSSESEDEHGHLSVGEAKSSEDEEHSPLKADMVRRVLNAKMSKQRRTAKEGKQRRKTRTASIGDESSSTASPAGSTDATEAEEAEDGEAEAADEQSSSSHSSATPTSTVEDAPPTAVSSALLPLPASLSSTSSLPPQLALLSSSQSSGFRSRQFELTVSMYLTTPEPITNDMADDSHRRNKGAERKEERKDSRRDGDDGTSKREWIQFALYLLYPSDSDSRPHSPLSQSAQSLISSSAALQSVYALTSACKWLLSSALKSPFGREVATLSYIDRLLSDLLRARHARSKDATPAKADGARPASGKDGHTDASALSSMASSSTYSRLLHFFFLFHKFVHLAISPSLSGFAASSAPTSSFFYRLDRLTPLFFQQNSASCLTFFTRSYPKLLSLAVSLDDHSSVVCIARDIHRLSVQQLSSFVGGEGEELLYSEMDGVQRTQLKDWMKALTALSYAYLQLGEVEQLEELRDWARRHHVAIPAALFTPTTSGSDSSTERRASLDGATTATVQLVSATELCPSVEGMCWQAQSRYREALSSYIGLLHSSAKQSAPTLLSNTGRRVLRRCIRDCFFGLRDWVGQLAWLRQSASSASTDDFTQWLGWEQVDDRLRKGRPMDATSAAALKLHFGSSDAAQPVSGPVLAESEEKAELIDRCVLNGYISLLSTSSLDAPSADPSALQSLKNWDIASTLLLDDLLHSSASYSPPASLPYSSPPSVSSLLSLSCCATLSRRSLAVLHPFIASFAEPVFASQLRLVDCMKALTAVQAVACVTALPSAANAAVSVSTIATQNVSRSFVLSVAHQCAQRGEWALLDTVLQMEAALPFPSTVTHRAELNWVRALQSIHRNDLSQALSLQWEVVDRMLVGQREKLSPPASEYSFLPIHLHAPPPPPPATVQPAIGETLAVLRAAHLLNLQHLVDAAASSADAKHSGILARLLAPKFHTLDAQAGALLADRSASPGFLRTWLQSFSLATAARLAPTNSEVWARYGEWCDAELKRKLQPAQADSMAVDSDWRAIHALVSSYQSLSAELMGSSVTDDIYRCMTSVVDTNLHQRGSASTAAAGIPAQLSPLLSSLYFDEETGDSFDLPPALVQAICAIAEKRQALLVSLSRTSLASLVSSVLVSPPASSASFARSVDVPLRLLTAVLESASDNCDVLSSAFLSLPSSTFLFIVPQLFAAVSHTLSAPSTAASSYTLSFLRALLVRIGEEWPDAVLFGLLARLSEPSGDTASALWRGLAADIDDRLATRLIQRAAASPLSTSIQPGHVTGRAAWLSLFTSINFSSSPTAFDPPAGVEDEPQMHSSPDLHFSPHSPSVPFRTLLVEAERLSAQLSRIGHLPEDTLLSAIRVLQADLPNRVKLLMDELEEEKEEEEANDWERDRRRIERFQLIVSPLVAQVEAVQQSLLSTGSPHELQFRRRWQRHLSNLRSLLSASSQAVSLSEPLVFGQRVAEALNAMKKVAGRMHVFSLSNVSPALAACQDSDIRLPGLRAAASDDPSNTLPLSAMWSQLSSIASFAPSFTVIRTKTRPKRLRILGSDGVTYPFLLKSREDLHVDARMMQTVETVNLGLAQQRYKCASKQCTRGTTAAERADHHCVRHEVFAPTYPVIPLSPSLGILRWIEHATPLFDLHRTKRRRDKERHRDRDKDGDRHNGADKAAERGSGREARELKGNELFMSRMLSALAQSGLSSRMPRKDWPLPLLRQVYAELVRDVPAHMVASYLSFIGCSAADVLRLQGAFVSSLAAMSMCGYVLGVGDRHLGNMLLDGAGRVVHIDYNVSLDRGRRLPVPEIVPFRLTGVLRYLCGDEAGAEGGGAGSMRLFRVQCRGVLSWLRAHQQPVLALLQSFVHSPVADWQADTVRRANKGALAETKLSETADVAIAVTLLIARLRRRQSRLEHTYSSFLQALQPVDNVFRRLAVLDGICQRAERGERLSEQAAELSELLLVDMDALQHSQQQLEQALRQQQRRAMTQHTSAQQEELARLQSECQLLATRYETATDIRQALTSRSLHFLPQLRDVYTAEMLDWLSRYAPSLGPLLQQHASDLRALRPLLSVLAKSVSSGCRAMAEWTRQGMDSLQRSVVALASGGRRQAWEAGCTVQDSRYADMCEMVAALQKALAALPARLEEENDKRRARADGTEGGAGQRVEGGSGGLERQLSIGADQFARDGLRRVKEKLDGAEPSANVSERAAASGTLTVAEHVDWLIGEATSVDNLCRMYEGWAPWI